MGIKTLKKILIVICIITISLTVSAEVIAAITNTAIGTKQNFGISLMHTSTTINGSKNINFGYKIGTKHTYRINAGGDYSTTILCLDKDGKFPQEDGANGTYTSQGQANSSTLHSANSKINGTNAEKISWLIRNALIPEDSKELKEQKLSKIFHNILEETSTTENPLTISQIKEILTEDDIVFALQCTLWQLTNGTVLNALQGTTDNGNTWDGLEGNDKWGYRGRKGAYIRQIINYYNEQLNGNLSEDTSPKTNPSFKNITPTSTILGRYVYIGPFYINQATNYYSIEASFKSQSGSQLSNVSYILTDKPSNNDAKVLPQTKEGLEGKDFYVRIPTTTAARTVEFKLTTQITTKTAEGTVWTNENSGNQPLLSIKRTEVPGTVITKGTNFDIVIEKQYDASLRKYITAIKRKTPMGGTRVIEINDRTPEYGLLPATEEEPFNQYEYRHKKNPLEVQVGDKIVYTIRVTNECDNDIIIKSITDYLPPSGIEYVSTDPIYNNENNRWQYTSNRTAITTKNSGWYLEPRQYAEVQIVCEVTQAAKGRVITNIAEITQIADENNKTVIDIDSEAKNIELPKTEEEWEKYNGNDGRTPDKKTDIRYKNKEDLSDANYYYKGQQDDDDFEKITVKLTDGEYNLEILKVDNENTEKRLQGAKFNITLPNGNTQEMTTGVNGEINTGRIDIKEKGKDTIKIVETEAPTGYKKITNGIELSVEKDVIDGTYRVKQVTLVGMTNGEEIQLLGNTIRIIIKDEKLTGDYDLQIIKEDKENNSQKLSGAKFEITLPNGQKRQATTNADGIIKTEKINITEVGKDNITIKELEAPSGYDKLIDTINIEVKKEVIKDSYGIKEAIIKETQPQANVTLNGNTIVVTIKNEKIKNAYDLALKKFITGVTTADGTNKEIPEEQKRYIKVTNVDNLVKRIREEKADAIYKLNKTPVKIKDTDYVTYTIRIFNEAKVEAIVKEIRDTIPQGLEYVPYETNPDGSYKSGSKTNYTYKWEQKEKEIKTRYTEKTILPAFDVSKTNGENKEQGLSYIDVKVEFKVNISKLQENEKAEIYKNGIKNIAEITNDDGDDNDSTPNNNIAEEDDQDYDVIIPTAYDLALKKFITGVTTADGTNKEIPEEQKRYIKVTNVDELVKREGYEKVDAKYELNKTPVKIKDTDYVTYTIRVFNEAKVEAIVKEIRDTIPQGLEYVPYETNQDGSYKSGSKTNYTYKWEQKEKEIKTRYTEKTILPSFDVSKTNGENKEQGLSYIDVKIEFKVNISELTAEEKEEIYKNGIKNIAEITNDDGDDNDSTPNNSIAEEDDQDYDVIIPTVYDLALKKFITGVTTADGTNKEIPKEQKRYIKVTNVEELVNRQGNQKVDAKYELNKTPVDVTDKDYVTYTIRVFNEGDTEAIIKEIIDTVPQGLEYVPYEVNPDGSYKLGSRTNYTYKWETFEKTEEQTGWTKGIKTKYLDGSKLSAFDKTKTNGENKEQGLSYIDVRVEFKVNISKLQENEKAEIYKNGIKNIAEITDDDGDDNDSTPNNKVPEEDDQDYDIIILTGYDLALKKFITEVTSVDGTNKEIPEEQKRKLEVENVDALVNRQGNQKADAIYKLNKIPVSMANKDNVTYTIRVFNEGNIDAIVKELMDTVPEGLEYVPYEVNLDGSYKSGSRTNYTYKWEKDNQKVKTKYLNGTIIPSFDKTKANGENKEQGLSYIDVKVEFKVNISELTAEEKEEIYKNGIKNIAEITNDDGDDNDSTPDNKIPEEDDQDYDIVIPTVYDLSLKKFITEVTTENGINKEIPEEQKRKLEVENVEALVNRQGNQKADAIYKLNKVPVNVANKDHVTYTIRVFNEGDTEAIIKEIIDTVPQGLEYVPYETNPDGSYKSGSKTNYEYKWETFEKTEGQTGWTKGIKTKYLEGKKLSAFDKTKANGENKEQGLSYIDVKVEFKVNILELTAEEKEEIYKNGIKNIAEITNDDGDDNDSTPDNKIPEEDDQDYDVVVPTVYDLSLKKFITEVTTENGINKEIAEEQKRKLEVENVETLVNRQGNQKADAIYKLNKVPVNVANKDHVTYTIRVFNEGDTEAIIKEIIDTVPQGLEYVPYETNQDGSYKSGSKTNYEYKWETFEKTEGQTGWTKGIKTKYLEGKKLSAFDKTKANGENKEQGLSYIDVKVEFKVNISELTEEKEEIYKNGIKNIAEITNDDGDDNDSTPDNKIPEEDDQDYDVVVPTVYDLSLKKFITEVTTENGINKEIAEEQKRKLEVENVEALVNREGNEKADAIYKLNKVPVNVANKDYVTYTIRVFNEGDTEAIIKEIIDTVPQGLEYVPYETNPDGSYKSGSKTNYEYKWETFEKTEGQTGWTKGIKTKYLEGKKLSAFDKTKANGENKEQGLSYIDVKVEFKVNILELTEEEKEEIYKNGIKNIAEITNDDGDDNDSTPDNKIPEEDDQDYDTIIPQQFDLALRKFITNIDNKEITDREPQVIYKDGKIKYEHTKEPKVVVKGQTVTYTLRIYNEGNQNGYAKEISDDLPEGITFLPNHETNLKYEWKMYDENGNETKDVTKAKRIKTNYLSKDKNANNLLTAFDNSKEVTETNPSYRDVKVAFEVTQDVVTTGKKVITNIAQITEDEDEYGNEVDDIDSIPDNNKEDEDDIDKEHLILKYFDLSLLKYVSKVIVTEDGLTKEIETGYDGTENPEPVVKVELNKKKLERTDIKYIYSIKITNEGEIEGYSTEITDRIPDGLEFYEEDNTEYNWKSKEDGVITTDYLKDTLLKPGESETIQVVLRWKKSEDNLGQKVNIAEITKDENEYNAKDVDSTPNNNKDGEDDQDSAIVVLTLKTGSTPIYITLIITTMVILSTGFYLIYKHVVK